MTRLEEIKARMERATEGPWKTCPDESCDGELPLVCQGPEGAHAGPICCSPLTSEDADFIAHARSDIPWLVARVEKLEFIALQPCAVGTDPCSESGLCVTEYCLACYARAALEESK